MTTRPVLSRLPVDDALWQRFHTVAPLVLVGTLDPDGRHDLAPKHLAMPLSWGPWFGFVCTPRHRTWQNVLRTGAFTATWVGPDQVLLGSLAAGPRFGDEGDKPSLQGVPVVPAAEVAGVLVAGGAAAVECELDRIVEDLGENGLIIGRVVAAHARPEALVLDDRDPADQIAASPLLAYVHPHRFARVDITHAFPFHVGWSR